VSLFDSFKKVFSRGVEDERSSLSRKVQDSPQDPQVRQKLGLFLLKAGEIVEGTDQLARAAILYEKRGFTTKAIAVLRQMLKSDPSNIDFERWIIRLFAQLGHTGDALSELQKVAAGGIHFSSDDQRIEFFRNVSESMPDHPLPHLFLADVYLLQRKMFDAVSEMEKAIQLRSSGGTQKDFAGRINILSSLTGDNTELLEPTGFLWVALGNIGNGLPFLERAAEIASQSEDPKHASDVAKVLTLLQEGRGDEIAGAMSFADAVEKLSGAKVPLPSAPAPDRQAPPPRGHEEERILQSAVEKLQAKVKEEIGESDPEARYNLGIAYKEMGLLDEAAEEFRLSRSTPSLFLGASSLLAETMAENGDVAAAIRLLDEVLVSGNLSNTEIRDVRYQKAILLSLGGREEEAKEIFVSLYETSPDYRDVREHVQKFRG
jgi:tetratricopeptide (TPR) repeat protein